MVSITIRSQDDQSMEQLRVAAPQTGARLRKKQGGDLTTDERAEGLGSRVHNRFSITGGIELDLPSRHEKAKAVDFSE
jgi:hypothetical protein